FDLITFLSDDDQFLPSGLNNSIMARLVRDTALVTCASEQIGEEMAKYLATNNYDVSLAGKDTQKLNSTVVSLSEKHGEGTFSAVSFDLSDFAQVQTEMERLSNTNHFNVVVICASELHSEDANDEVHCGFRLNVIAHFLIARFLISRMDSTKSTRFVFVAPNPAGYDMSSSKLIPTEIPGLHNFFKKESVYLKGDGWHNYTRLGLMTIAQHVRSANVTSVVISPIECVEIGRIARFCGKSENTMESSDMAMCVFRMAIQKVDITRYQERWINGEFAPPIDISERQYEKLSEYLKLKTDPFGFNTMVQSLD
ncbi:hypothetical protein PFISCL1PPCAC_15080, partial [Pristionchus fissidentatus]